MEAASNSLTSRMTYTQCDWGDSIHGTKEQLQSLGLGVGVAFPGEPGGPKRVLNVVDPAGCQVKIALSYGTFWASRTFHDWPKNPARTPPRSLYARGVDLVAECYTDEYEGTAEALVAAGLVREDQLPGRPGMRKMRVTIYADGSVADGPPTANHSCVQESCARTIERSTKTKFKVVVRIAKDEHERRQTVFDIAESEWRQHLRKLRRPPPLCSMDAEVERSRVVEFLATVDPGRPERAYMGPLVAAAVSRAARESAEGDSTRQIAARHPVVFLKTVQERIDSHVLRSWGPAATKFPLLLIIDPLHQASVELQAKISKRPSELCRSSKLYRAIEDIALARKMPRYSGLEDELYNVMAVLRDISGWTEQD